MIAFDTEDDGKGTPNLFCAVTDKGSFSATSRLGFLIWLSNQKGDIWATNLEYDLLNVFGSEHLHELKFKFGHSALLSARWKNLRFLDTVRHVPASVKQLGEWVGLPKLERDGSKEYCFRDAAITRRAAEQIGSVYQDLGSEAGSTLASNALRIWRTTWSGSEDMRTPIPPVFRAARETYHGGRTEIFYSGEFKNVSVIDMSSAFPWAMLVAPFPVPWGGLRRVTGAAELQPDGLYRARVHVPVQFPFGTLPFVTKDGLCFPRGTWESWYFGHELTAHKQLGGTVEVILEGWEFVSRVSPFHKYIEQLWEWKARARGLRRQVCKLLLNGLYGKFGERGERTQAVTIERFRAMNPRPPDARLAMGLAFYRVHAPPPRWANVVWSALVTARARVRLLNEAYRLHKAGCKVLYCDTDSLFFQGTFPYPVKASAPGDWELRDAKERVILIGKKEYGTLGEGGWVFYAKGIPSFAREDYIRNGVTTFERPNRLREAIRNGRQPNVWETREKVRRKVVKSGIVPPILLEGGKEERT